ncbi:MAG TPA: F0F1 ATP synthase subunit epsilon [Candidatus Deferrimicrobium sp.]|nr:F0F1 ATP synthase subunit epsilon [Candidatus Deferrimicrobium sp.]
MADFKLEVVSPEGSVLSEDVQFVILPAVDGEIGIMANHSLLISQLKIGLIRYTKDGKVHTIATSGGYVEVADNRVVILADTAERGDVIDLQRATEAKERAQKRLNEHGADIDLKRAEYSLHRAVNRIKAVK